jgi:hypothetical protein
MYLVCIRGIYEGAAGEVCHAILVDSWKDGRMHMEAEESRSVSAASSVVLQGNMGVRELLLEANARHPIE